MKKRLSILVALIMAFTIFWIPGQSVFAVEGEDNVSEDSIVQAMEDEEGPFTVTFYDGQGNQIGEPQTVKKGESATAPADPTREGYNFTGWNPSDFSNVTADMDIIAQWEKKAEDTVGAITVTWTATQNAVTLKWAVKGGTGKVDGATIKVGNKAAVKVSGTSGTINGLDDGTYHSYSATPYLGSKTGVTVTGTARTNCPKGNSYTGPYMKNSNEYYYVKGIKQKNQTIQFKDTNYGTNKYNLFHYYDGNGIFRGRTAKMYNRIKNMSSTKYLIAIDRTNNVMCIYVGGKGKWRPYKYWSCVTGRLKGDVHPTPLGTFRVKSKKLTFSGYGIPEKKKNKYSVWYCSRFCGGVFIHSQLYKFKSKSAFIPGGKAMGVNASHGCVRLFKDYSYWVYKNCGKGTTVVVMQ